MAGDLSRQIHATRVDIVACVMVICRYSILQAELSELQAAVTSEENELTTLQSQVAVLLMQLLVHRLMSHYLPVAQHQPTWLLIALHWSACAWAESFLLQHIITVLNVEKATVALSKFVTSKSGRAHQCKCAPHG